MADSEKKLGVYCSMKIPKHLPAVSKKPAQSGIFLHLASLNTVDDRPTAIGDPKETSYNRGLISPLKNGGQTNL